MIQLKYIILLVFLTLGLMWACRPAPDAAETTRSISEALAENDADAARKCADELFAGNFNMESASVTDLCDLAVALVRLSESGTDNTDYTAQALKCYSTALERDSLAATARFDSMSPESYPYVQLLRQLRRQVVTQESELTVTDGTDEQ